MSSAILPYAGNSPYYNMDKSSIVSSRKRALQLTVFSMASTMAYNYGHQLFSSVHEGYQLAAGMKRRVDSWIQQYTNSQGESKRRKGPTSTSTRLTTSVTQPPKKRIKTFHFRVRPNSFNYENLGFRFPLFSKSI